MAPLRLPGLLLAVAVLGCACIGNIGGREEAALNEGSPGGRRPGEPQAPGVRPPSSPGALTPPPAAPAPGEPSPSMPPRLGPSDRHRLHRLTRDELAATLEDLVGLAPAVTAAHLPEDGASPFTHDLDALAPTSAFVYGAWRLAEEAARRTVAEASLKRRVVSCTTEDGACLSRMVTAFGRRAFRRPLAADERKAFEALGADVLGRAGFDVAVEVLLRAFMSSASFLYRSELGGGEGGGPATLAPYEASAKLSYLLLGTAPDEPLLRMAEDGSIMDRAGRLARARAHSAAPRATAQILRFHAEWLGYARMPHEPAVAAAYREEADLILAEILLRRKAAWPELLSVRGAPGIPRLSSVYGLKLPDSRMTWTDLPPERRGLLARAAFLSVGAKAEDTSPTARGKFIRERLLCQEIPPPPPEAESDLPPASAVGGCKVDRYVAHRADPACSGCHALMDPVGFGLERFDQLGRYRTVEVGADGKPVPRCPIAGTGELVGVGSFSGAAALADLLLAEEKLERCMTRQFLRFALGRKLDATDEPLVDEIMDRYRSSARSFTELVLAYVSSERFVRAPAEALP